MPLSFDLSVTDENGKLILDHFNWSKHFSQNTFNSFNKKQEAIIIEAGRVYSEEVILFWPNMLPGNYRIQISTSSIPIITSNVLTFIVK